MSAAGGIASGLFDFVGAIGKKMATDKLVEQQREKADELRNEARAVKKPKLNKRFVDFEKAKALSTLSGMSAYDLYKREIEQDTANAVKAGKEGATGSAGLLTYLASTQAGESRAKRGLQSKDLEYRKGAMDDYTSATYKVGQEDEKNRAIQRKERDELRKQAGALENAATANAYEGTVQAIDGMTEAGGSMVGGFSSMGGGMGGGAGASGGGASGGGSSGLTTGTPSGGGASGSTSGINSGAGASGKTSGGASGAGGGATVDSGNVTSVATQVSKGEASQSQQEALSSYLSSIGYDVDSLGLEEAIAIFFMDQFTSSKA